MCGKEDCACKKGGQGCGGRKEKPQGLMGGSQEGHEDAPMVNSDPASGEG